MVNYARENISREFAFIKSRESTYSYLNGSTIIRNGAHIWSITTMEPDSDSENESENDDDEWSYMPPTHIFDLKNWVYIFNPMNMPPTHMFDFPPNLVHIYNRQDAAHLSKYFVTPPYRVI